MQKSEFTDPFIPTAPCADDAVGVPSAKVTPLQRHWCIAVIGRNTEKACRERLQKEGVECFVASQEELHKWANGRKKVVERILISAKIFVYVTEPERLDIVKRPYINYFLTNKAKHANDNGFQPIAHISDHEMQMLQFMLGHADAPIDFVPSVRLGDHIRIIRGPLKGFEGHITRLPNGETYAVALLDVLGCALAKVDPQDIEIIKKEITI